MSTTTDLDSLIHATQDTDTPYAPAPAADDPHRGREVFAPVDGPFEVPVKKMTPGPFYVGVEERMPDLAERPLAADAKKSKFPVDRRDFLKFFSASTVAATTACVQRPVETAIPYVNQPNDQFPGEPVFYASTCGDCSTGCGVMVRTREGRPTKVEGLPEHPVSQGRLCAVGQASLQGLYHPERRHAPGIKFGNRMENMTWADVYEHLGGKVTKTTKIGIFTGGSTGHRHQFYREWLKAMGAPETNLYTFDPNQMYEAVTTAHKLAYGVSAMPRADLHNAKMIVGIGADFLDVGTNLLYNTREYTQAHSFNGGEKATHVQFEASFTMTGGKADTRYPIPPGSETLTTLLLVRSLMENKSSKGSSGARGQIQQIIDQKADLIATGYDKLGLSREVFDRLAEEMLAKPSVIMAGGTASFDENATNLQLVALFANELLGAYETILFLQKGWQPSPVNPGDLTRFINDAPGLDILIVINSNPAFFLPPSWSMPELLGKIPTLVSIQDFPNETEAMAHYALNGHHWIESWGDEQPLAGTWSARQPAVRPITGSRQAEDILIWLAATAQKPMGFEDYRSYLKKQWEPIQQLVGSSVPTDLFFDAVLHGGFVKADVTQAVGGLTGNIASYFKYADATGGGLKLVSPLDFRLRSGEHAHKPALQEATDTLTTITWDTFVALSPSTCQKLSLRKFDVVKVEGPGGSFEASVYPLPGLHPDVVLVPRGNGHATGGDTISSGNGVNPLIAIARSTDATTGAPVTTGQTVKLTPTGAVFQMAQLQKHNDIANRKDIVKRVGLEQAIEHMNRTKNLDDVPDLYPALPKMEYRWGMSIDLDKCTGCQACYVACSIENNVPQVGREQVLLGREMHWIKIDRYFAGDPASPEVMLQPMLCQHCQHAPCEAVCPVYATTHDPEGINAMTYNRCIGTRYCANACPYKIRRFNWWTHKWNEMGERLQDRNPRAMNPDVTVRTRGVMEKCSFCYQRVRDAKHRAKLAGTVVKDKDLQSACQQTCPAEAIVFGNLNDVDSKVHRQRQDNRAFLALGGDPEEGEYGLKTLPNVSYMAKVPLKVAEEEHGGGHGEGPAPSEGGEHHG